VTEVGEGVDRVVPEVVVGVEAVVGVGGFGGLESLEGPVLEVPVLEVVVEEAVRATAVTGKRTVTPTASITLTTNRLGVQKVIRSPVECR
jgi:hypothetical protein